MSRKFDVRQVGAEDFAVALDWAAAEGWNPGLDDLEAFFAADPHGFWMGFLDEAPVTSISVVRYGDAYGFLGFYIAAPGHRGAGLGLATWEAGMRHLGDRVVGLDGVVEQQDNYRKSGFVPAGRNVRFAGAAPTGGATGARAPQGAEIAAVAAYDARFMPGPRDEFIARWLAPGPHGSRSVRAVFRGGEVAGFGVVRRCREGFKIGPLFADDAGAAEEVFAALCEAAGGEPLILDVPEGNSEAAALAERAGLAPVFETARMYRGGKPDLPVGRIFGITSFELG